MRRLGWNHSFSEYFSNDDVLDVLLLQRVVALLVRLEYVLADVLHVDKVLDEEGHQVEDEGGLVLLDFLLNFQLVLHLQRQEVGVGENVEVDRFRLAVLRLVFGEQLLGKFQKMQEKRAIAAQLRFLNRLVFLILCLVKYSVARFDKQTEHL